MKPNIHYQFANETLAISRLIQENGDTFLFVDHSYFGVKSIKEGI